jgi:hypothetical protein
LPQHIDRTTRFKISIACNGTIQREKILLDQYSDVRDISNIEAFTGMPKKLDIPASIKKIVDSYYEVDFIQIYNFATFIDGSLIINPRNKDECGNYAFVIKVFNRDDGYQIGEKKVLLEVSDKGTNKPKCPYKNPKQC